jgi:hypothetical protein
MERFLSDRDPLEDPMSTLLHLMILWGTDVCFPGQTDRQPAPALKIALGVEEDPFYQARPKPVFIDTAGRLRVRTYAHRAAPTGELHIDQTVATLARLGVPLSQPLGTPGGKVTLRDAFRELLLRYKPDIEQEWTALAIAYYLPPETEWENEWGEHFRINDLAQALLSKPMGADPCKGTHQLEALSVLLRVNEQYPILDDSTRSAAAAFLKTVCDRLEWCQQKDGAVPYTWAELKKRAASEWTPDEYRWQLLLATGHHLEWIAVAPPELRPSDAFIGKAAEWCFQELTSRKPAEVAESICPPTHALKVVYQYYYPELMQGSYLPVSDHLALVEGDR